jgi:2-polyprenyl-3-methyl-5-hydroxy-6-metoxy-1,4-benzoquinol methylase
MQYRSASKELLDRDDIPFEDIKKNMQELDFINTWLGGHAITINGVKKLWQGEKQLHICEIGCGGGDNIRAISKWASNNKIKVSFTGIDINPHCIAFAKQKNADLTDVQFVCCDFKKATFQQPPDIIFSSLFCHHFSDNELHEQLEWSYQQSKKGFFINDLHRNTIAYHLIKCLTMCFSRSYLVKNDAPLSVQRGFVRSDWEKYFYLLPNMRPSISWKWAFRWLIVVKK